MAFRSAKTWVPLAIAGGGLTGALAAFYIVRRELRRDNHQDVADSVRGHVPAAVEPEAPKEEQVSPEIVAIISAAVSAYLGKTARVRGIRPALAAAASPWSQAGRVSIQGSHILARQ